jgi:hypothetical protein
MSIGRVAATSRTESRTVVWKGDVIGACKLIDPSAIPTTMGVDRFTRFTPAWIDVRYSTEPADGLPAWRVEVFGEGRRRVWYWEKDEDLPSAFPLELRTFVRGCIGEIEAGDPRE